MAETETRRRYVNYGRGEGNIPTHDEAFIAAFKRQKQAAAAAASSKQAPNSRPPGGMTGTPSRGAPGAPNLIRRPI
ncbi:hypothetical protein LCGC14_1402330 [marine sediment metagenome]|uniref:Uncharacterized protein n=1 Tax=marine sediment metagenome TaxID=412755 RepID=A0A0F9KHM2_9ZZZZ